jgi:1-acyl-sn-glycerol-3-phosphate acyltransferase
VAGFKATLKLLRQGETILVFPEGTRSPNGQLQRFHPGFCALARRSGATIVPVAIRGAYAAMPRGSVFPRPKPIALVFGQPIGSDECNELGDEPLRDLVLRRIQQGLAARPWS